MSQRRGYTHLRVALLITQLACTSSRTFEGDEKHDASAEVSTPEAGMDARQDSMPEPGMDAQQDADAVRDAAPGTLDATHVADGGEPDESDAASHEPSADAAVDASQPSAVLQALHSSRGSLEPAFDPSVTRYVLALPLAVDGVELTPSAANGRRIAIAGMDVASDAAWRSPWLSVGDHPVSITVSADHERESVYDIIVRRSSLPIRLESSDVQAQTFGTRVALSGDTLVVTGEDAASRRTVEIWIDTPDGWQHQAILKLPAAITESFWASMDLDGDTLVMGSCLEPGPANEAHAGAAYVFTRSAGSWSDPVRLQNLDPRAGASFGESVAISGDTIVVGAPGEDAAEQGEPSLPEAGASYVFVRTQAGFVQQARLRASNAGETDYFGASVSIDNDTIAISAPSEDSGSSGVNGEQHDESAIDSGSAYVFMRSAGLWTQQAYLKAQRPEPSVPQLYGGDQFGGGDTFAGRGLDLSGDTLAIGAAGEDSLRDANATDPTLRYSSDTGAIYVFQRNAGTWALQTRIQAKPSEGNFGCSVALLGDRLIGGAWQASIGGAGVNDSVTSTTHQSTGTAYDFTREHGAWTQTGFLKSSAPQPDERFGWSVAISEHAQAVGAPQGRAVYVFPASFETRSPMAIVRRRGRCAARARLLPDACERGNMSPVEWRAEAVTGKPAGAGPRSTVSVHTQVDRYRDYVHQHTERSARERCDRPNNRTTMLDHQDRDQCPLLFRDDDVALLAVMPLNFATTEVTSNSAALRCGEYSTCKGIEQAPKREQAGQNEDCTHQRSTLRRAERHNADQ